MWCIPPKQNAAFVAHMEQVLDVYQRLYDARYPVICMDESHKQLLGDVQPPLPVKPGQGKKDDCNYERHGTGNLFITFEPARGQRLVDDFCPAAERITLVCDQLKQRRRQLNQTVGGCALTFPNSRGTDKGLHR